MHVGNVYHVVRELHKLSIANALAAVNDDGRGGTAPGPLELSAGSLPKRRRVFRAVKNHAMLPCPDQIQGVAVNWIFSDI